MKQLFVELENIGGWPQRGWIRHLQSTPNATSSSSNSSSDGSYSTSSEMLTIFFLMLGFCFLNAIWRYCRLQMVEERDERRLRATLELARQQIAAVEVRPAGEEDKTSAGEKRNRILRAFAPVRLVLEEKHFPMVTKENALTELEEGVAQGDSTTKKQISFSESDGIDLPSQTDDCTSIDEDAVMIEIPLAGLAQDQSPEREQQTRTVPGMCSICLSAYQVGSDIVWSSNPLCEHVFHEECIENWLMKKKQKDDVCPCCRRDFIAIPEEHLAIPQGDGNSSAGNGDDRRDSTH